MSATPKQKFNRFAWRDDVFADTDVPAGPKCLAYGVAQFINCETGEAIVGTRKLAKVCGFSQSWVRKQVPLLAATGWMQVHVGRRGSGEDCSSRYKMIRNRVHPVCSHPDADREHFSPLRVHPVCSEPLNHIEGAPSVLPSLVDRQELPMEISARESAYYSLSGVHPKYPKTADDDAACRAIFFKELDNGTDPEQIISAAEHCENTEKTPPMILWLQQRRWQNHRY
jgi:hypothetical protein